MYLNESQIAKLARFAVNTYEFSCDWKPVYWDVQDAIYSDYGFKPRHSLVKLVIRRAQVIWEGHKIEAQRSAAENKV